ncbi:hypothetical protein [Brenneria izbisi]|nr:hypothetical protein [Brenneria izbisi]
MSIDTKFVACQHRHYIPGRRGIAPVLAVWIWGRSELCLDAAK